MAERETEKHAAEGESSRGDGNRPGKAHVRPRGALRPGGLKGGGEDDSMAVDPEGTIGGRLETSAAARSRPVIGGRLETGAARQPTRHACQPLPSLAIPGPVKHTPIWRVTTSVTKAGMHGIDRQEAGQE